MARQWSARCYGVARQREGSRQTLIVMDLHHLLLAGLPAHSAFPPIATELRTSREVRFVP
jgi:hypothetical protein